MEFEESLSNTKNNDKIKKALQNFLKPNFKIRNDAYLNLFLKHLACKDENDAYIWQTDKQLKEQLCQWLIGASKLWGQHNLKPQASVFPFALNLASQVSVDEEIFFRLNCQNVYERLVGLAQTNSLKHPTVTLGLVSLLSSLLEHKNGLQWVMATNHWTDMINLSLKAHTMYMRKKAYQFVIKLLEKAINFNRNFAVNMAELLIKPLKDFLRSLPSDQDTQPKDVESRELLESLKPSLDLILETTETLLKRFNKKILELFLENDTSKTIEKILLLSRSEEFSFELLQIQFVLLFYQACVNLDGLKVVDHDSVKLLEIRTMFDLIRQEMYKRNVRCVVQICDYAHELFCVMEPRLPKFVQKGSQIEFQDQMVFFQIGPIFSFSDQLLSEEELASIMEDFARRAYYKRWVKICVVQSIRMGYKWMEGLQAKSDLVEDVVFCFQYISKMKRLLNPKRAAIVFSALVFCLDDAITTLKKTPSCSSSPKCKVFLKTLVETIVDLVETFDLTWKDCMETISVMDLAYDFLYYPDWADNVILIGLKLLTTAISRCMSPDMVLLISHTEDSKVFQTGSLLYGKCHSSSSEIRDGALEVVFTLSLNANTKFPEYADILLKAKLPQLVVDMALNDGDYYVRATAFKCLQELIQIPEIWSNFLNMETFLDNMLAVFVNELEGIVRKEAAALIFKIDKFQKFPEEMLPRLYDVMTHAAVGDPYWEVKYNALDFWFNLWDQHFSNEGMIDHKFPSHTFSKEHKKIVALNEAEVRKRIIKVLNQLSHIGCLNVMKSTVKDGYNVEVSKKATSFTLCMINMFKMYKIPCENVDLSQPPSLAVSQKKPLNYQVRNPTESSRISAPSSAQIVSLENSQIPCEKTKLNQKSGRVILLENIILKQPSSTVSSGAVAPYPDQIDNLGSPQFSNSPFFDPVSPFNPFSPSNDLDMLTPPASTVSQSPSTLQNSPQLKQTPPGDSVYQQELVVHVRNTSANQIAIVVDLTQGMDMSSCEVTTELAQKNMAPNDTSQITTKKYLAPSQYLKFVYNEIELHIVKKSQSPLNSMEEFESLLDDILKL